MKETNRSKCLTAESMGSRSGRQKKQRSAKMVNALHRANHRCEMCGAEDSHFFPLQAYHLDGADMSWDPNLTVILCPSDLLMTARGWPPGSGWQNGTPHWAYRRDIFRAVLSFAQIRGPAAAKKKRSLRKEKSKRRAGATKQTARSARAVDELLAGKSTVPDPEQKKRRKE